MLQTTTITQKWQMTLPKKIRELLGIDEPGVYQVEVVNQKAKTISIKPGLSLLDLAGSIPSKNKRGKSIDSLDIRDFMEKNYERV